MNKLSQTICEDTDTGDSWWLDQPYQVRCYAWGHARRQHAQTNVRSLTDTAYNFKAKRGNKKTQSLKNVVFLTISLPAFK